MSEDRLLRALERLHRMLMNRDRSCTPDRWMEIVASEVDDLIDEAKYPRPDRELTSVGECLAEWGERQERRRLRTACRKAV